MDIKLPIELFKPPQEQLRPVADAEALLDEGHAESLHKQSAVFAEYLVRVPVKVQGVEAYMLIDTGASRTVFDKSFVEPIAPMYNNNSLKTMGAADVTMPVMLTDLQYFSIGDLCIPKYVAAVIELAHINAAFVAANLSPIVGLIGLDILARFKARIDFRNQLLRLSFSKREFYNPV